MADFHVIESGSSGLMPFVSVVVPCYQVEKYLPECLDSIVNQTLDNIEIILVNDGSPDNSLSICQAYAAKDSRIKIIDQENGGLSVARNNGLKIATGKYILFVDSDDWIDVTTLEKLTARAERFQADVVLYSSFNTDENGKNSGIFEYNNFSRFNFDPDFHDCFNWQDCDGHICYSLPVVAWGGLYSHSFLVRHSLRFPEGLFYEDNLFFRQVLFRAERMSILNEALYFYRRHSNNITAHICNHFEDRIKIQSLVLHEVLKSVPDYYSEWWQYIVDDFKDSFEKMPLAIRKDYFPLFRPFFIEHQMKGYETILNKSVCSFVEEVLSNESCQDKFKDKLMCYWQYFRCTLFSYLTSGKRRQHYCEKRLRFKFLLGIE